MRDRKTAEEKAAQRRAAWDKKVADTAARDAAEKAARKAQIQQEVTYRALTITAKANKCAREGRPLHFPPLGITVRELTVYLNANGVRPLGPLPAARATFERLPPTVIKRSPATQVVLGVPASRTVPRAAITVIAGTAAHRKVIEGQLGVNRAEEQVKDFNALVSQVPEEFRR